MNSKLLKDLRIASPCDANWDEMSGNEQVRFCHLCKLNVYNISTMSTSEAEALIRKFSGKRLCARIYQRKDGTVITDNCPVGLRAARDKLKQGWAAAVLMLVALGFIQAAQAQGFVGAPVDPRFGSTGEVGAINEVAQKNSLSTVLSSLFAVKLVIPALAQCEFWRKRWFFLSVLMAFNVGLVISIFFVPEGIFQEGYLVWLAIGFLFAASTVVYVALIHKLSSGSVLDLTQRRNQNR